MFQVLFLSTFGPIPASKGSMPVRLFRHLPHIPSSDIFFPLVSYSNSYFWKQPNVIIVSCVVMFSFEYGSLFVN